MIIKLLKHLIQIVAFQISQFFVCMWINKLYMQALLVCYRIIVFWLIINSADFRSILILKLADIKVSYDDLSSEIQKIWQITTRMNFMIVAQFYHQICTNIFNAFLAVSTNQFSIFNQISNYFDMIKINKKNMLHFYFLIWFADNFEFCNLQFQLQNDAVFVIKMIYYLKSVIKCYVDLTVENLENLKNQLQFSFIKKSETDSIFVHELNCDSNIVAFKWQMHNKNHTCICFKYIKKKSWEYRFFFFINSLQKIMWTLMK